MKYNKTIILGIILIVSISSYAQKQRHHEITLGGGIGQSALQYNSAIGGKALGFGGHVGLGYTYFFGEHFGIGTGFELSFYNSKLRNGEFHTVLANLTDPSDGEIFDFHSKVSNYYDKQKATYLNIPIMLHFQTKGVNRFYAAAGTKIGIPLNGKSISTANFENSGYFHSTTNWASTQNFMGFGTFTDREQTEDLKFKTAFMLSLEAGMKWKLGEKTSLYTGLYFDYGLNNILDGDAQSVIDYDVTASGASFTHHGALYSSYTEASTTTVITEKVVPMSIGIKLNLAFGLGKTKGEKAKKPEKPVKVVEVVKEKPAPTPDTDAQAKAAAEKAKVEAEQAKAEAEKARIEAEQEKAKAEAEAETRAKEEQIKAEAERAKTEAETRADEERIKAEQAKAKAEAEAAQKRKDAIATIEKPIDNYKIGETVLLESQKRELDVKIALLKQYPELTVVCVGHTCDIGGDIVNERVGRQRAEAAKAYLVSKGIDQSRISTITKRDTEPLVPNTSEENRKQNRRIALILK